jgi:hypothetical protein
MLLQGSLPYQQWVEPAAQARGCPPMHTGAAELSARAHLRQSTHAHIEAKRDAMVAIYLLEFSERKTVTS